ncbi:toll/interleukin-1 receptor domain-containing protein [Nocardia sp. NRRL S-836]|uniref:toll/interleukin-1 receptor domain-containing protein n=1 Tax=Nocardia sp. NRRL S-836 TaxID=1519492 RepID=UPI0006AF6A77|nr:TIR domain-containing protein [Nocardia sp. NRRL S-836]
MTKYDICLSFAGEDRGYVDEVARHLKDLGVKVFYDNDAQVDLWGKNLTEYLDEIYRNQSRYCLMFVSKHYAAKMWTRHERQSAFDRAMTQDHEYVLPVRFDDTVLPGLRTGVGYLDGTRVAPRTLAEMAAQKLGTAVVPPQRQAGWEYELFSDTVRAGLRGLQARRVDHDMAFAKTVRTFTTDTEAIDYFTARTRAFDNIINAIADVLSPQRQQLAFGANGQRGDEEKITRLATMFVEVCSDLLAWAADLRGTRTPDRHRALYEATARLADQPLRQIDEFVERFTAARGSGDVRLTIDYDPSEVEAELTKVQTT